MKTFLRQKNGNYVWRLFAIFVAIVLLASCGNPATPTATPGNGTESAPTPEPTPCDGGDGKYSCQGLSGHEITITDVPDGVVPYLLNVSTQDQEFLLGPDAKKEGTACIFMLAGDLAFYDESGKLVERFEEPVSIAYAFLDQDQERFNECQDQLVADGTVVNKEDVSYVPVYYHQDIWRPFKAENVDNNQETRIMTIKFTAWGDQPIGGGSQP